MQTGDFHSEKQSEINLDNLLKNTGYNFDNIFYSTSSNKLLKTIFSKCSKKGNGRGEPDRIYYDGENLFIFECKKNIKDIDLAKTELLHYVKNINTKYLENINICCIAFIREECYKIYNIQKENLEIEMVEIENTLLGIKPVLYKNNTFNLSKDIKLIHDYIYKHTKISNEDKSIFMAIILIGLKNNMFSFLVSNINEYAENKIDIYSMLMSVVENIFQSDGRNENIIDIFKHIKHNKSNEKHIFNIIQLVSKVYNKHPDTDLLNQFYSSFIKYGSMDSKSLGIVLTPDHIVKLMNKIININQDDVVLDLCSGTGSFVLESLKYSPKKIIACEYQFKLFSLLKTNFILRDVNAQNYDIYNIDCFTKNYNATKSLINPPYGLQINEWEFILKQLESIEAGGEACAIVPNSVIFDSKNNRKYKEQILLNADIINIILCRNTLFYPVANISTVIIHFKKKSISDLQSDYAYKTNIIDYRDDGFVCERTKGFVPDSSFQTKFNNCLNMIICQKELKYDENWYILQENTNIQSKKQYIINSLDNMNSLELQIDYLEKLLEQKNKNTIGHLYINELDNINFKNFKVKDMFRILTKPLEKYDKSLIGKKYVFQVAAKNNNNGVKDIVLATENTFTANKIVLVVGGDGGSGLAYYLSKDFIISSSVKVLEPFDKFKNIMQNKKFGIYIANMLSENKKIYNRGHTWKNELILDTNIFMPVNQEQDIDIHAIEKMFR